MQPLGVLRHDEADQRPCSARGEPGGPLQPKGRSVGVRRAASSLGDAPSVTPCGSHGIPGVDVAHKGAGVGFSPSPGPCAHLGGLSHACSVGQVSPAQPRGPRTGRTAQHGGPRPFRDGDASHTRRNGVGAASGGRRSGKVELGTDEDDDPARRERHAQDQVRASTPAWQHSGVGRDQNGAHGVYRPQSVRNGRGRPRGGMQCGRARCSPPPAAQRPPRWPGSPPRPESRVGQPQAGSPAQGSTSPARDDHESGRVATMLARNSAWSRRDLTSESRYGAQLQRDRPRQHDPSKGGGGAHILCGGPNNAPVEGPDPCAALPRSSVPFLRGQRAENRPATPARVSTRRHTTPATTASVPPWERRTRSCRPRAPRYRGRPRPCRPPRRPPARPPSPASICCSCRRRRRPQTRTQANQHRVPRHPRVQQAIEGLCGHC